MEQGNAFPPAFDSIHHKHLRRNTIQMFISGVLLSVKRRPKANEVMRALVI